MGSPSFFPSQNHDEGTARPMEEPSMPRTSRAAVHQKSLGRAAKGAFMDALGISLER
jgi:hypothetical protein